MCVCHCLWVSCVYVFGEEFGKLHYTSYSYTICNHSCTHRYTHTTDFLFDSDRHSGGNNLLFDCIRIVAFYLHLHKYTHIHATHEKYASHHIFLYFSILLILALLLSIVSNNLNHIFSIQVHNMRSFTSFAFNAFWLWHFNGI